MLIDCIYFRKYMRETVESGRKMRNGALEDAAAEWCQWNTVALSKIGLRKQRKLTDTITMVALEAAEAGAVAPRSATATLTPTLTVNPTVTSPTDISPMGTSLSVETYTLNRKWRP